MAGPGRANNRGGGLWRRLLAVFGLLLAAVTLSAGAIIFLTADQGAPEGDPNPPRPAIEGVVDNPAATDADLPEAPVLAPETLSLGSLGVTARSLQT